MDYGEKREIFGRTARFAVVPVEVVRAFNIRSNEEVIDAQKQVGEEMVRALEEMVNAARAGRLEGEAALAMEAIAW